MYCRDVTKRLATTNTITLAWSGQSMMRGSWWWLWGMLMRIINSCMMMLLLILMMIRVQVADFSALFFIFADFIFAMKHSRRWRLHIAEAKSLNHHSSQKVAIIWANFSSNISLPHTFFPNKNLFPHYGHAQSHQGHHLWDPTRFMEMSCRCFVEMKSSLFQLDFYRKITAKEMICGFKD